MTSEKLLLLSRTKLAIIRKADVLTARDQIEKVFLQIRTGAGDGMDFVPANHFRQRNAEFRGAHGARERDHHFSAAIQMRDISVGGIFQHRRVEMPEMAINELADAAHLYIIDFRNGCYLLLMLNLLRSSQALITLFLKFSYGITARKCRARKSGLSAKRSSGGASQSAGGPA